MSAYIVDRATIHALVHAAVSARSYGSPFTYWHDGRTYTVDGTTADEAGEMLTRENVRSVRARYPDCDPEELPGRVDLEWAAPYTFPLYDSIRWPRPDPAFIFKQMSCYEYQSCETDDWRTTRAAAFCEYLRTWLCSQLPGYEVAPWGTDQYPPARRSAGAA